MISAYLLWRIELFFFFSDTAATEIYTLSLHDALPISQVAASSQLLVGLDLVRAGIAVAHAREDRKSTRLNSSHSSISYAVFCLKKKSYMSLFFISTQRSVSTRLRFSCKLNVSSLRELS